MNLEKKDLPENNKTGSRTMAAVLVLTALVSMLILTRFAASPDVHARTIQSLDEKKTTVMELAAASTAASAAITLLPGDTATPIADKLADLSSYFLLVLCAIYLEKYMLTIIGYAAFGILIPLGCGIHLINIVKKNSIWKVIANKLILFGAIIVLVIPISVKVSDMIEKTYSSSIQNTIDSAEQTTAAIENSADSSDDDKGFLEEIVSNIKDGVAGATAKVENVLNNFIEALAIMIVTSCLIPILILVFMVWLVKVMLGVGGERLVRR